MFYLVYPLPNQVLLIETPFGIIVKIIERIALVGANEMIIFSNIITVIKPLSINLLQFPLNFMMETNLAKREKSACTLYIHA